MTDRYLHALVAFSSTDLIGYHRFLKIKKNFKDICDFLDCDVRYQMDLLGLKTEKSIQILQNMKFQADKIIDICLSKGIDLVPHTHVSYPSLLKEIFDPPYLLYSQGNLNGLIPMIAVIGTRKSTHDAEQINRWFCKEFVQYGLGVVSGLAQGHDSIAAETVLQHEGYSIGVLGTAIDIVYPKGSQRIIRQLKETGCIISEYPPGMATTKWRFPRRNRIVSGLSKAVCVIQAPEKSGTMITVNMAQDQGKDVFVIPGNPMIPQNSGTNLLIQKGAKVAINPMDIIQDVLKHIPEINQFVSQESSKIAPPQINYEEMESLSSDEKTILGLLEHHTYIDELARESELNVSSVISMLTLMELRGLVVQKPGNIYIRGDKI